MKFRGFFVYIRPGINARNYGFQNLILNFGICLYLCIDGYANLY